MEKLIGGLIAGLFVVAMIVVVLSIVALPFMWLWNWLMPEIFGITTIGFWQAWGLLILSSMIFSSGNTKSSNSNS